MSPTYTYRCQHGHEIYAARKMSHRHVAPEGRCCDCRAESCTYELVMSQTSDPVVKGGTPKHHGRYE